eukprot:CAMPEP_0178444394 /NCGR_PEP_ID=MMETSP0689_2-20121128/39470_1 /TAXON_ID=160604 /ORGANISM="Amphidinium massartii, Strain CS-259" /LENGTH=47 /DNA_ID= /DNA_START= /DNA_END= /DNA_ORIENTATION=
MAKAIPALATGKRIHWDNGCTTLTRWLLIVGVLNERFEAAGDHYCVG